MQFIERLQSTVARIVREVVQLAVRAARKAQRVTLTVVLPALNRLLDYLRITALPFSKRLVERCFSRALPLLSEKTARLRHTIVHAYRKADHLMPGHHLAAAAGLAFALSLITFIPDKTDAHSGKTVINLSTGDSYTLRPEQHETGSSEEDFVADTDTATELDQVLSMTEFSLLTAETESSGSDDTDIISQVEELLPAIATTPLPESVADIPSTRADHEGKLVLEVESGDNLSLLFQRAGLSDRDVYLISRAGDANSILTRLYPGYTLVFDKGEDRLESLEIVTSPLESYLFTSQNETDYSMEHKVRTPEIRQAIKQATINDSLFLASQRASIPNALTMEVAAIFGGVIDFIQDTRKGDSFTIIYEEKYLDGLRIGTGQILAVQYTNQGSTHTALRYEDAEGSISYYNPQGESMRKAFLRNPVDFVRISSDFNPNRRHPILNTIRAHKGTDYAAPTGTPVVATADGRVTWASRNGSFGNLVVIDHNGSFETKYAHLNKYASGIKVGSRVKQGQVIGYVGSTGSATGPHLHYEFLMDGIHRNPRTIHSKLPKAESIAESELPRFLSQTSGLLASIEEQASKGVLASLDSQDLQ